METDYYKFLKQNFFWQNKDVRPKITLKQQLEWAVNYKIKLKDELDALSFEEIRTKGKQESFAIKLALWIEFLEEEVIEPLEKVLKEFNKERE